MSDMVSAIPAFISGMNAAMDSIPGTIASNVPSTDFATVLADIQNALNGPDTLPAAPTDTPPTSGTIPVGSFMGGTLMTGAPSPESLASTASQSSIVATAEQYLGTPYVWGGSSPQGFDCSGLVQYVYGQNGVALPRTSDQQALQGVAVPDVASAQPGDLVFFAGSDGTPTSPGHVGIYIGNGQMIDAPQTGQTVQIQPVGDPVAIRRVLANTASTATPASGSVTPTNGPITNAGTTGAESQTSLQTLFDAASARYGLPAQLLPAIASVESGDQTSALSSAGAQGLMQLMPATSANLGIDPYDPAQAIDGAARLLNGYLAQFGSLPLAIAAYNAGPGAVESYGALPPYPQTQTYVAQVMAQMGQPT